MRSIYIKTLGCPKNEVDSYELENQLHIAGYQLTNELNNGTEIAIVNTCAFIENARKESREVITELLGLKTSGKLKKIIIAGCFAEKNRDALLKEFPQIDGLFGNRDLSKITHFLNNILNGHDHPISYYPEKFNLWYDPEYDSDWVPDTFPYAFIKIADGCNNRCSYCVLPALKGQFRSLPVERLLQKITYFVTNGYKEIILVAQDTALYGIDIYGEQKLHSLIEKINAIPGDFWLRVMYLHPAHIYDTLIKTVSKAEKVVPYLETPIQHIEDDILERMNRKISSTEILTLVDKLKDTIPDLHLRTTLIVGFPGETADNFNALCGLVEDNIFDHVGLFPYSHEEGTPAYHYDQQVPQHIISEREDTLAFIRDEQELESSRKLIGKTFSVVPESSNLESNSFQARLKYDAPEIDRTIQVAGTIENLADFYKVKIVDVTQNNLIGVKIA